MLGKDEIQRYRDDGFIVLDSVADAQEVARLREIFERLFAAQAGRRQGNHFDLAGTDAEDCRPVLPQILNPVELVPELAETGFRARAQEIARQLLGPDAAWAFEHAILKPAGYGAPTPWHQDEAHRSDAGVEYGQLSIWMPLQEATLENGCMEFLPGSHHGPVLEHQSPGGDKRVMALECIGAFDAAAAARCPLPPGGATVHHCRTLHHAGANRSAAPRYAYILAFRGPAREDPDFKGYPWNAEKFTAAQARREAWENRGGALGRASRRAADAVGRAMRKALR
jgi:ectoine hydroxylase-related dioxygenase (phytanoyl-CoA dioxygenase family)